LFQRLEKGCDALVLAVFNPYPVNAGPTSIGADFSPGPPQNVRPEEAVVKRMESTIPTPFRRLVELALELS
jgi:hypothetical protein